MFDLFNIKELLEEQKILIAVSGGSDSIALMLLANDFAKQNKKKIYAITIDHKIRKESKREAIYVKNLCKKYNIEHITKECQVNIKTEEEARNQRYNLIFDYMEEQNIKIVLLAHHRQDQAENFLIRLFRGSNINGLSSMKKISIRNFTIIRPLLDCNKEELQQYLISQKIGWCEDKSNDDDKYLRNKIRLFLNSFKEKDLIINRINKAVDTFQIADNIIKNSVRNLDINNGYTSFSLDDFRQLSFDSQYQLILNVVKKISLSQKEPRADGIKRIIESIYTIKNYTLHGCIFHKVKNIIIVFKE